MITPRSPLLLSIHAIARRIQQLQLYPWYCSARVINDNTTYRSAFASRYYYVLLLFNIVLYWRSVWRSTRVAVVVQTKQRAFLLRRCCPIAEGRVLNLKINRTADDDTAFWGADVRGKNRKPVARCIRLAAVWGHRRAFPGYVRLARFPAPTRPVPRVWPHRTVPTTRGNPVCTRARWRPVVVDLPFRFSPVSRDPFSYRDAAHRFSDRVSGI